MSKLIPQTITCRAAVVFNSGEAPSVEEIQVEPPKTSEVRVKMLYASFCHTDILFCQGFPVPLFPRIPGHEGVGVIESVGENVTNFKEGDMVMPLYIGECNECPNCMSGRSNLCHKYSYSLTGFLPDGTSRMSINGQPIYHLLTCSTWSEYTVLDVNFVVKADSRLPLSDASALCCGFTTGFGAALKEANIEKGSTVAVLGLGTVGLGAMEGARINGASKIIGVDINEKRYALGKTFGLTDFINPKSSEKSVSQLIKDITGGLGVDYVFECTGVPALQNEAMEASKVGLGTVVMLGLGTHEKIEISVVSLISGRKIIGSSYGGIRPSDLPSLIDKCINKEIDLDGLLTHELLLSEANKAFEYSKNPDCVKLFMKF
ncbi:dehydrogenase [Lithospermum erythrorhizon]|uniref:Dehydrogenase n=1 Tax=Lithospermum erythrorhizon TaxID=34254 RepID=A0AAV3RRL7_LITER